jgi:hypothetical protein
MRNFIKKWTVKLASMMRIIQKGDFIIWYTCKIINFYVNEKLTKKGLGTLR